MTVLAIVGGSESTARALSRQLETYLAGRVNIKTYWVNGGLPDSLDADLFVLSSELVLEDMRLLGCLPVKGSVIVGKRTVDPDALEKVVALPVGTKVLFVNDRQETAGECVESLLDLGLDAVSWLAWHPALPPPPQEYAVAVVAGEPQLVPQSCPEIIDIGARIFGFGTIAEIFARLHIPYEDIESFSRRYLAKIVSLARRLAKSTEEARRLSGHLGSVINSLSHGVLVYDMNGRVSVCNEELKELLALRAGAGVGSSLVSLVRQHELLEFLESRYGQAEAAFKLPGGTVLVQRFDLDDGEHTVAVFRTEGDIEAVSARLGREYRRRGHVAKWVFSDIVGESESLRHAKKIAAKLASTDLSILVHGESGTGKELFASAIHAASARSEGPFLAVDLGSLSDDLIESELFGYEEGAFTGAKKGGKPGLFEQANGGTLFLDEIGNISPKVQTRLLRVLQEREVMRVGGSDIKKVDVRVIAASNEDIFEKARRGQFREDLYFRLKMGWLSIPPLRERRSDIPALIERFLELEGQKNITVSGDVLESLSSRDWPGNVRELRNMLTYMLAVREGSGIGAVDLPDSSYFESGASSIPGFPGGSGEPGVPLEEDDRLVLRAIAELETNGSAAGRDTIAELICSKGFFLGPGSVRASLKRLGSLLLVCTGRGRKGSRLTSEGRRILALVQ